ncbi:MAG: polyamine aminopropyltransferase [Mariprofundaceae bacterium]|nr:polyamine aminopropyltransferase [Mariprofundaceae bacterium]
MSSKIAVNGYTSQRAKLVSCLATVIYPLFRCGFSAFRVQLMKNLRLYDMSIFIIMASLAACGLIYEYLLSHYAGRILGAMEIAVYTIIGIMIVSMGIGAFLARLIRCPFTAFVALEVGIAVLGASSVLVIGGCFALSQLFPEILIQTFGLPDEWTPRGGMIEWAETFARLTPYLMAALLGMMIGMEIPLIARVRQHLYQAYLEHNTGTIYGMDYIGAGVGAALWVMFMLSMDVSTSASLTASVNLLMGLFFLLCFRKYIRFFKLFIVLHVLVAAFVLVLFSYGSDWESSMEDMLYTDHVVYRLNTPYQHLVLTERLVSAERPKVLSLYINGHTQFASNDEHIYHSMLVYPALAASARHEKLLLVGGGDGLALRDMLRWNPEQITVLELDAEMIRFFSQPMRVEGEVINQPLLALNEYSFSDPRVNVIINDAFSAVDDLIRQGEVFDSIIVDLPDPSHPDLNKLYSTRFYAKLKLLLAGDGALVVQSTSPYHAKNTFLCIAKTMQHAGFSSVEQYHHNVPSFGEWGWSIAVNQGQAARQRLAQLKHMPIEDAWLGKDKMLSAFVFSKHYYDDVNAIKVNRLGSGVAYQYHQNDWRKTQGVYWVEK